MTNNNHDIAPIGLTNFRSQRRRFGIKLDDRRRHMYLIGKTGMGKSTMLENMIVNDIREGHGVAVVDPHGDLVEKILDFIPANRINDVIYFNPGDQDFPVAFNILETVEHSQRHLVASGMIGVFKKIWADSWGPRLEYVLRNAIMALLDYPGSTMLGIMRMLVDKNFRKKVIERVEDPVVKSFWVDEYSKYPDRFQSEAIAPIQNKVGQFLSNPLIRNIVGQVKSTLNIREVIDGKKILLMNLAKGRIGEDTSGLLGAMMITKLQLAAMGRIDTPEKERRDFFLYVDEFQNFATESFANILSEARKYRLNLIIAHQYIEQLDEKVMAAVFGNVGTLVCFRVGGTDADYLVKEFTPRFIEEDLVNLPKYNMYLKLMIDGVASDPFSAIGLPPLGEHEITENRDKIIHVSRERYALPRTVIEEKIARWASGDREEQPSTKHEHLPADRKTPMKRMDAGTSTPRPSMVKSDGPTFSAVCDVCGADTTLSFKPDPAKPIYCKDCLKKVKSGELPRVRKKPVKLPPTVVPGTFTGKPRIVVEEPIKEMSLNDLTGKKPPVKKIVSNSPVDTKQVHQAAVIQQPAPSQHLTPQKQPSTKQPQQTPQKQPPAPPSKFVSPSMEPSTAPSTATSKSESPKQSQPKPLSNSLAPGQKISFE